jgi:hypothetical protein
MALLMNDGFDSYSVTSDLLLGKWNNNGGAVISTTGGRFGGGAMQIGSTNSITGILSKSYGLTTTNPLYFGFWFKQGSGIPTYGAGGTNAAGFCLPNSTSYSSMISVQANTGYAQIMELGGGVIGTTSVNICDNNWHWIEMAYTFASTATGSAKLYIDGVQLLNLTNIVTMSASNVTLSGYIGLYNMLNGNIGSPSVTAYYDDVLVWDNTGTAFNTFPLGPQRISTLKPNADGDLTQFTPSTAGTHYNMVNGGYTSANNISDTGTGNTDLYKFPSLPYTPATVNAVIGHYYGQNPGTGSANLIPQLKTGTTTVSGSTDPLANATNKLFQQNWYTDATGAAWTANSVNSMQIGLKD